MEMDAYDLKCHLLHAVENRDYEGVQRALLNGADPNCKMCEGESVLQIAQRNGLTDICKSIQAFLIVHQNNAIKTQFPATTQSTRTYTPYHYQKPYSTAHSTPTTDEHANENAVPENWEDRADGVLDDCVDLFGDVA